MAQYLATSAWVKERSRPIVKWSVIAAGLIALGALGLVVLFEPREERR